MDFEKCSTREAYRGGVAHAVEYLSPCLSALMLRELEVWIAKLGEWNGAHRPLPSICGQFPTKAFRIPQ